MRSSASYFDANKEYAFSTKTSSLHHGGKLEGDQLSITAVIKDWVEFSSVFHFMARYGLLRRFKRGVDLGGAEGTCIRLFKAAGYVEHATNVDIDDYSNIVDDALFERLVAIARNPREQKPAIVEAIKTSKRTFGHFDHMSVDSGLLNAFPNAPTADENLVLDLTETPGQYDLVTSFCCFDYLEMNKALAKVRSLLVPGGLFVGMFEYWWWPINSTGVIGHFPYAGARLSFDDLLRYYGQFHKDLLDNLYTKYHYFHEGEQRPTITDWMDIARANGLRPIAAERIIPVTHHRLGHCPPQIFAQPWFDHREVLRDIHHIKPDVTVDDLHTSAIKIAFVAD